MAITCPACSKTGQTESACQRCGCDLSRLHAIVTRATSRLQAARASLEKRDWTRALIHAEQSWRLCHTIESAQMAFLSAAAGGETALALVWRQRARAADG